MNRLIAAVSFAVLAVPAFAAQLPFEQTELDRALPQIEENASAGATRAVSERNQPFEQTELDRAFANVTVKPRDAHASTRPFVDHNIVSPAL